MRPGRERIQNWLWRLLAERIPGGTYAHPRLSRALFCWPCEPVPDDCNKPERDYCARCGRLMPGQAPRGELLR